MIKIVAEFGNKEEGAKFDLAIQSDIAVGDVVLYDNELYFVRGAIIEIDKGKMQLTFKISKPGSLNQIMTTTVESIIKVYPDSMLLKGRIAEYDFAKATYEYLLKSDKRND